jgi:hypothetical protein
MEKSMYPNQTNKEGKKMLKKILIASILFLLIITFSNSVGAANNLVGNYQIVGGDMPASVNFPKIVTMSISLPNLGILKSLTTGTYLIFDYYYDNNGNILYTDHGPFGVYLPELSNTNLGISLPISSGITWVADWVMKGTNKFAIVTVDEKTGQETNLEALINDLLSNLNLPVSVDATVPHYVFTGSLSGKHTLSISLAMKIGVTVAGGVIPNGTITLNGIFTTGTPTALPDAAMSAQNGRANLSNELAHWVVHIIKKLPLKYVAPAN